MGRQWVAALWWVAMGCGGVGGEAPVEDAAADVDAKDDPEVGVDAGVDADPADLSEAEVDAAPVDPEALAACEQACGKLTGCARLTPEACVDGCLAADADGCGRKCLELSWSCELVEACLGVSAPVTPLAPGPYGKAWRELAGPVTLPTTEGEWRLEEHWNGEDSFVFLMFSGGFDFAEQLWSSDLKTWLTNSPPNVHYFFLSYLDQDGQDRAAENVAAMKARVDAALDKVHKRCQWQGRLHYVPVEARTVGGWVGEMLQGSGTLAFAIDPAQRIRQVGMLHSMVANAPQLSHLNYELAHYAFERQRAAALAAREAEAPVTEVVLTQGVTVHDAVLEVALPSAEAMAGFDTLEIDLGAWCPGHDDANCGEWDYLSHLWVCEAGSPPEAPCEQEVARWITTYRREGRWVTDITPMLATLREGGARRFRFAAGNPIEADLRLRLSNRGVGARPAQRVPLFQGGAFDAGYNAKYAPRMVDVPAWATRAELVALVTGHGFGVEVANCAEFCNHTHHWTLDGHEVVETHDDAGTTYGCANRVSDGVVPNQYGTWTLGRGGWCPGQDVAPFVVDVTAHVTPGAAVEVTYQGLFQGQDYVPVPGGSGDGFPGNIRMESFLVFYE